MQYAAWLVMWMTWNVFIICFYLEVGDLSRVRKQFFFLIPQMCLYIFCCLLFRETHLFFQCQSLIYWRLGDC